MKIRSHGSRSFVRAETLERRVLFAAGDLDTTFGGGDGVADTDLAGWVAAIAFTDDGSVVVVGSTPLVESLHSGELALVRYTPDGRLDTRFAAGGDDGDGQVVVHGLGYIVPGLAKIDPEGRIIVTLDGYGSAIRLVRFNANGTRDMGFGEDGVASAYFGHGSGSTSLRILDDGKILVGVAVGAAPAPGAQGGDASARFNPDGSADLSYGHFGIAAGAIAPRTRGAIGSRRTTSTSPTHSRRVRPRAPRQRPLRTRPLCRRTARSLRWTGRCRTAPSMILTRQFSGSTPTEPSTPRSPTRSAPRTGPT